MSRDRVVRGQLGPLLRTVKDQQKVLEIFEEDMTGHEHLLTKLFLLQRGTPAIMFRYNFELGDKDLEWDETLMLWERLENEYLFALYLDAFFQSLQSG